MIWLPVAPTGATLPVSAPVIKTRGLLPIWPSVPPPTVTLSVAPVVRLRLPNVRSTEFTPVPPGVTVSVELPVLGWSVPAESVEAVCARPL